MKAIMIIDMPKNCYECKYCRFDGGFRSGYYGRNCLLTGEDVQVDNFDITKARHKSCPLKFIVMWDDEINIIDEEQAKLLEGDDE